MTDIFLQGVGMESGLGACLHDMLALQDNLMRYSWRPESKFMEERYTQLAEDIGLTTNNLYADLATALIPLLAPLGTLTPAQQNKLVCFEKANMDIENYYGESRALARLPADHRLDRLTSRPIVKKGPVHPPTP